jgi:hypothetical protein
MRERERFCNWKNATITVTPGKMQDASPRELAAGQTGVEESAFIISQAPLMCVCVRIQYVKFP